ncbi:response regulator transcription factor [Paenibacillus marinisediminis]
MFTILIVDDEKIERDGIKLLIEKYKYDLQVIEAENGEKALEYIRSYPVDILFTDIKMPFIGGLELAEEVSRMAPATEIIIYSAYGEFDYARRALHYNASSYILKPIDIHEFNDIMTSVIEKCAMKQQEQMKAAKLLEGYQKGIEYEKEKWLIELLSGTASDHETKLAEQDIPIAGKPVVLMLIEFTERIFDKHNEAFADIVNEVIDREYEWLNINERQSVLFIHVSDKQEDIPIKAYSEALTDRISRHFQRYCCIVYGSVVSDWKLIGDSFAQIEQTAGYKFFFEDNVILYTGDDFIDCIPTLDSVDTILANIYQYIDDDDYTEATKSIELLFNHLSLKGNSSAIYVKYLCSDMVKKACDKAVKNQDVDFKQTVERIFKSDSILQVKEVVLHALNEIIGDNVYSDANETKSHIVLQVIRMIEKEFMNDISLEIIARRVSLNPSYLSHLFKKETGQSLIKYITMYRLEQAKVMLQKTNMKIVDICESVGYWNSSYFCLTFKKYHGVSPQKYREMIG